LKYLNRIVYADIEPKKIVYLILQVIAAILVDNAENLRSAVKKVVEDIQVAT
jgi:hypothetical protein